MRTAISAMFVWLWIVLPSSAAPRVWVEQKNAVLSEEREMDGDSFGMMIESAKGNPLLRTYRLYGVDCPESDAKDPMVRERIEEQAKFFGVPAGEIPVWGMKAKEFTKKLLMKGKPRVLSYGPMGEEAKKTKNRPQRYYAMVEVTGEDGKRHWLHELLLAEGLARAFGIAAPWPEKELKIKGEEQARERFKEDLEKRERKAKRDKTGIWKRPG